MVLSRNLVLALSVTILSIAAFAIWNRDIIAFDSFPSDRTPVLVAEAGGGYPADFADTARQMISWSPLDQRRVNALYAFEARRRGEKDISVAGLRQAMAAMGWRDTAAQQNLIAFAARGENLQEVAVRADALLRRQRVMPEMLDILHIYEDDNSARRLLAPMLARRPEWRTRFFSDPAYLRTDDQLSARMQTLRMLIAQKIPVERREIAAIVAPLVSRGKIDAAYQLWRQSLGTAKVSPFLADPDFTRAAAALKAGDRSEIPFEWQFNDGPGYNATAERTGGTSDVRVYWDGSGTPIFLRQRFRAEIGQSYAIRLEGLDAKPELMRQLSLIARCPKDTVRFERPISAKPGTLLLGSSKPMPCLYPELTILPNLMEDVRGFDISLSGIDMHFLPRERVQSVITPALETGNPAPLAQ